MIEKLFNRQAQETEEHWVSISDVMAGLMVIFLFIAISYMMHANRETEQYKREKSSLKDSRSRLRVLLMFTEIHGELCPKRYRKNLETIC